jgi:hypothetical protein
MIIGVICYDESMTILEARPRGFVGRHCRNGGARNAPVNLRSRRRACQTPRELVGNPPAALTKLF